MPVLALAPEAAMALWGAVGAGSVAGAQIYGAHKTSSAAKDAAKLQTDAANHAADLQKQSADAALAFQNEQAKRDYASAETTRHANYDQWVARERRISSLGDLLGLGPRDIPGYVPMPAFDGAAAPSAPGATSTSGNVMDPAFIGQQVTSELAKYGVTPGPRGSGVGDVAYWVDKIREGKGWEPYWADKIRRGVQGTASAAPTTALATPSSSPLSIGAYLNPTRPTLTPALELPVTRYAPRTLGSYV